MCGPGELPLGEFVLRIAEPGGAVGDEAGVGEAGGIVLSGW